MEPLMTTEEVGDFLRVDVVTVRRLVNKNNLVAYRIGSEYRFARADIQVFLNRQCVSGGNSDVDMQGERFARFTHRARRVIMLARDEAVRLNHTYIGTEHLLLGLVREGEGVAAITLRNLGVDLDHVRERVEFIIGRLTPEEGLSSALKATARATAEALIGRKPRESAGLTPRARRVIELAVEEAQGLNHQYIGTEHLLLAMLSEGEGIACKVLKEMRLNLDRVRAETLAVLGDKTGVPAEEMSAPPAIPAEADALVPEGAEARDCSVCGARSPHYFRFCFNCGQQLVESDA
jgi:excisionase family DNA binding protein